MKKVSIDLLEVGDVVEIVGAMQSLPKCKITYIGQGVFCYVDKNGIEFTGNTASYKFYVPEDWNRETSIKEAQARVIEWAVGKTIQSMTDNGTRWLCRVDDLLELAEKVRNGDESVQ